MMLFKALLLTLLTTSTVAQKQRIQHSGPELEKPYPKYFKESEFGDHYDARYAKSPLKEAEAKATIVALIQTYLATFRDLGVQTWLMHGTLLGWWWGKHIMPWDPDADLQVTEADMFFLAAYHNMTTYYYDYAGLPDGGRTYLLEVNPNFKYRGQDDTLNVIDARWIDMTTGVYIDITAARYDVDHPEGEGILYDKHGHQYRDTYLYPLRKTTFEGEHVLIPYKYEQMLRSEYGDKALEIERFHGHEWNRQAMRWESQNQDL